MEQPEPHPTEIAVIIYCARGLPVRKKGRGKYSVVFGVGTNKFKTDVVVDTSGCPEWNEESTVKVTNSSSPLLIVVRESGDAVGQISLPLDSLTSGHNQRRMKLQPHKKCPEPYGELVFDTWIAGYERLRSSSDLSVTSKQSTFGKIKRSLSPLSKRKLSPFSRKKDFHASTSSIDVDTDDEEAEKQKDTEVLSQFSSLRLNRRHSRSLTDLASLDKAWPASREPRVQSLIVEETPKEPVSITLSVPLSHSFKASSCHDLSTESQNKASKPEITGISPNEGPVEGGTRLAIRGYHLGTDKADVVGLFICGANCLGSLEYESPTKIFCRTKAYKPIRGFISVETQSGGRGISLVQFTFKENSTESESSDTQSLSTDDQKLERRNNKDAPKVERRIKEIKDTGKEAERKSGLFSWRPDSKDKIPAVVLDSEKNRLIEEKTKMTEEIKKLKTENGDLKEKNEVLHSYIDFLVVRVLDSCPEILSADNGNKFSYRNKSATM